MTKPSGRAPQQPPTELEEAIDQAKEIAADIREAADNLAVVNTVLQDQLPEDVQTGEVEQALGQSDEVEKTIAKSAETLESVNSAIEQAVRKRA